MENKQYYFYVLICKDESFYGGYTVDLERRIKLHNEGKGAKYTRGRGPVRLIYSKSFPSKSEAMKAEYEFKSWSRKKKKAFLIKEGNEANGLGTKKFS